MHIYHKQCEIIQKIQWKDSNGQLQWFNKAMRDDQTNIEDRATQPMEAGGWVSQKWHIVFSKENLGSEEPQAGPSCRHATRKWGRTKSTWQGAKDVRTWEVTPTWWMRWSWSTSSSGWWTLSIGQKERDEMGLGGAGPLYSSTVWFFGCRSRIVLWQRLSEYNKFWMELG